MPNTKDNTLTDSNYLPILKSKQPLLEELFKVIYIYIKEKQYKSIIYLLHYESQLMTIPMMIDTLIEMFDDQELIDRLKDIHPKYITANEFLDRLLLEDKPFNEITFVKEFNKQINELTSKTEPANLVIEINSEAKLIAFELFIKPRYEYLHLYSWLINLYPVNLILEWNGEDSFDISLIN